MLILKKVASLLTRNPADAVVVGDGLVIDRYHGGVLRVRVDPAITGKHDIVAETGYFSLAGQAAEIASGHLILAETGIFSLAGQAAGIVYSGPQFARPVSDIETTGWSTTPLWQKLDEVTPDDATTEISTASGLGGGASVDFEIRLSGVVDPLSSSGHVLRVRVRFADSGGDPAGVNVSAQLKEGGTVRATLSGIVTGSYATFTKTLSAAEADSIGNYTNLRARVVLTEDGNIGDTSWQGFATWVEFEVPAA